jgi:hypothetical protein
MFKRTNLSTKGSLLLIALVSTVTASQLVCAEQPNDAQVQARTVMQGAQIASRGQNIEADTFVDAHQSARNLIAGSASIKNSTLNVVAGNYIDPHQRARNVMTATMQAAPSVIKVAR